MVVFVLLYNLKPTIFKADGKRESWDFWLVELLNGQVEEVREKGNGTGET